jgi:hypothetical protein
MQFWVKKNYSVHKDNVKIHKDNIKIIKLKNTYVTKICIYWVSKFYHLKVYNTS